MGSSWITDKKDKKREQIISAALKCFFKYGYLKTTFGEIAKQAGISRFLMYSYFKNKSDLFISINEELQDRHLSISQEIIKSNGTNIEKLTKIIDEWTISAYRDLRNNLYANELLDGMIKISDQSEKRFRRLYIKSLEPLIGKDVAELIVFSIKGLLDDRPPVKTLIKRLMLLIEKVAQPAC